MNSLANCSWALHDCLRQGGQPERRRARRFAFRQMVQIAPYDGTIPPFEAYRDLYCWVEAQDLSTRGLSFRIPRRPPLKSLLVRMWHCRGHVLVSAEITNIRWAAGTGIVCGCRLTERLDDWSDDVMFPKGEKDLSTSIPFLDRVRSQFAGEVFS